MINLKVSEAYAFDYLAILQIKCEMDTKAHFATYAACVNNIIDEIGDNDKWNKIMNSSQYQALYDANKRTFNAVTLAKKDEVIASYVDKCNNERFLAKKALHKKFFPEEAYNEKKVQPQW